MAIPAESLEPYEDRKRPYYTLHHTWITVEDEEIDLKLRVLHTPAYKEKRVAPGVQIEPDQGAEDQIEEAWWLIRNVWEVVPDRIFEVIEDREVEFLERIGVI